MPNSEENPSLYNGSEACEPVGLSKQSEILCKLCSRVDPRGNGIPARSASVSVEHVVAAAFPGKRWRPRPKNDSYKPKSSYSTSGANANDDAARRWRLKMRLTLHLHGPNNRKANYFPSMPLSGNLKVGVCKMPSADISSISRIPRHCYLLMLSVICIISMWQMGTAHSFPKKMNWAFKGA